MTLKLSSAPYQRGKRSTRQIMIELSIGLSLAWIFGIVYTFIAANVNLGIKAILNMIVAVAVAEVCDVLTALCMHKKGANFKDEILGKLDHNYSYVSAMILVLILPVWTSYYLIILGTVFAVVVVKNFFGGFGKNIFNPAALARIFIMVFFSSKISPAASGIESIASGTVTSLMDTSVNWISFSNLLPEGYTLSQVFLGTYFGSLGETSTLLILLVGIVLAIRKDINWRTPSFYLGTVLLTSLFMALIINIKQPFEYAVASISLGGVAFGAVFMLTDPVTGPTSNFGKCFIGVIAGFLTVLIRIAGGYPEGTVFAIAICNMISPVVDYLTKGKTNSKLGLKYGLTFGGLVVAVALNVGIATSSNGGRNVYEIGGKDITYFSTEDYKKVSDSIGVNIGDNMYFVNRDEAHQPQNVSDKITFVSNQEENLDASYSVYTNKNKFVGYAYHIELTKQVIETEYADRLVTCNAWVVVDCRKDNVSILGAHTITTPSTTGYAGYESVKQAIDNLSGYTKGEDFASISSATESSKIISTLINTALNQARIDVGGTK